MASRSPGTVWHDGRHGTHREAVPAASAAVTGLGWRYVLGEFRTEVLTGSLPLAADVAARAAALPAPGHLRMDIRADRLLLSLQTAEAAWVTTRDAELARQLSAAGAGVPADHAARGGGAGRGPGARDRHRRAGHRPDQAVLEGGARLRRRAGPEGRRTPWSTRSARGRPSGSSRWTRPGRSATGSTSTSRCRTTRRTSVSRPRWRRAARSVRRGGAGVLGAGRPRGQRGLHHHLAGPRRLRGFGSCCTSDQSAR